VPLRAGHPRPPRTQGVEQRVVGLGIVAADLELVRHGPAAAGAAALRSPSGSRWRSEDGVGPRDLHVRPVGQPEGDERVLITHLHDHMMTAQPADAAPEITREGHVHAHGRVQAAVGQEGGCRGCDLLLRSGQGAASHGPIVGRVPDRGLRPVWPPADPAVVSTGRCRRHGRIELVDEG
jgi:hypothetical protein